MTTIRRLHRINDEWEIDLSSIVAIHKALRDVAKVYTLYMNHPSLGSCITITQAEKDAIDKEIVSRNGY